MKFKFQKGYRESLSNELDERLSEIINQYSRRLNKKEIISTLNLLIIKERNR